MFFLHLDFKEFCYKSMYVGIQKWHDDSGSDAMYCAGLVGRKGTCCIVVCVTVHALYNSVTAIRVNKYTI